MSGRIVKGGDVSYATYLFLHLLAALAFMASIIPIGLFLAKPDPSLGGRMAGLIAYSYVIFYFCFCDSKHHRGYSLRKKEARKELPRLMRFHLLLLVLLSALHAILWHVSQHLPSSWLAGFYWIFFIFTFSQLYVFRGILSRVDPDGDKPY